MIASLAVVAMLAMPTRAHAQVRFEIPATARQRLLVSNPSYHPANYLARFRAYRRAGPASPWRLVFGP